VKLYPHRQSQRNTYEKYRILSWLQWVRGTQSL
jgi:hypothetical protein